MAHPSKQKRSHTYGKEVERQVAELFQATRVGNTGCSTNDIETPLFSIEVKARTSLPEACFCAGVAGGATFGMACWALLSAFRMGTIEVKNGRLTITDGWLYDMYTTRSTPRKNKWVSDLLALAKQKNIACNPDTPKLTMLFLHCKGERINDGMVFFLTEDIAIFKE